MDISKYSTQYPEMICVLNDLIGYRFGTHVGVEFIQSVRWLVSGLINPTDADLLSEKNNLINSD